MNDIKKSVCSMGCVKQDVRGSEHGHGAAVQGMEQRQQAGSRLGDPHPIKAREKVRWT
jgi:hypothetical protein